MPAELALWLYCIAWSDDSLPEGLPGVDAQHAAERVEHGGLAALVSRVSMDEFGEEPLRENLGDLAWLERVARSHEAVLERALEQATIVPVRLCTIFADADGVVRLLDQEREALEDALGALAGRGEWSVKLLVDRTALEAAAGVDLPEPDAEGSGAAYMLRRRHERQVRELADGIARDLAHDVHARICDGADDAVVNAPQNRELSGHAGEMLLNGAYLVETAAVERLRDVVAELEERHRALGARLELSGPFPPYNFVQRQRAAPA